MRFFKAVTDKSFLILRALHVLSYIYTHNITCTGTFPIADSFAVSNLSTLTIIKIPKQVQNSALVTEATLLYTEALRDVC